MKLQLALMYVAANLVFCETDPLKVSEQIDHLKKEIKGIEIKTPQELVEQNGYPFESHYLTTSDGYILNLHRIPHGISGKPRNNKVAFLHHGLLLCSTDWILFRRSLAYKLADEGYDVWMGNNRGNQFSRNHTTLDPDKDAAFWKFSWHEIGIIDMPATIDYLLNKTGVEQIYVAGHSQGSTVFYVLLSSMPEYNEKIRVHVSLAPVAYMNHLKSPLARLFSPLEAPEHNLLDLLGANEFLPTEGFVVKLKNSICTGSTSILCENVLFALCGFSPKQINITEIPMILSHTPAGAATKQLVHYAQEINSGRFCQYDHGLIGNLKKYGAISSPDYDLSKITTKIYLIYSGNDWFSSVEDVIRLYNALPNVEKIETSDFTINHVDYVYGLQADEIVYSKVVESFSKY